MDQRLFSPSVSQKGFFVSQKPEIGKWMHETQVFSPSKNSDFQFF